MDRKIFGAIALLLLLLGWIVVQSLDPTSKPGTMVNGSSQERWYSERQVAEGGPLFQTHCASCHGPEAASTPNWRELDENGNYPPPPLDGSAHAWHHSLDLLRKTVRDGGIPLGGQMPPFREILAADEIDSVLAWVQTHWSDEIYSMWSERNG